ncbi:hypothetical protein [Thalassoroseus pseudoceratinae]|uniref:hypothetical protein n=1 Tax=Thalassoroseus pseudoceratinae TaxID=2713176 RepID=UPI00141F58F7|nr:hypothetical protein [Thalassoroseus pseudoceratinae]
MKPSLSGLKNIDWKQLVVNHGEKIALGVVGLLVVFIVAGGTRWSTFQEKQPQQIKDQVVAEDQTLMAATWPDSEKIAYPAAYNVQELVSQRQGPIDVRPFVFLPGHPLKRPLHRQQKKIQEPEWLAPQDPEVYAGQIAIAMAIPGMNMGMEGVAGLPGGEGEGIEGFGQPAADFDNPFGQRPNNAAGGEGAMGLPGGGGPGRGPMPMPTGGALPGGGGHGGGEMEMTMMGGGGYGGATAAPTFNIQGERYVSVRLVYPYRKQVEAIAEARSDRTQWQSVLQKFQITDFEIQRQKAKAGPNPWSDKDEDWRTINKELAMGILNKVDYFDADIVDLADVDPSITMPLPARLDRNWITRDAGHKRLKTLTEKERDANEALAEMLQKSQQMMETDAIDQPVVVEKGGFAGLLTVNTRGIMDEMASNPQARGNFVNMLEREYGGEGGTGMVGAMGMNNLESALQSIPELILFRFFDFDVEPGAAYRYRVRIIVTNPNYQLPLEQIARPEVAQETTRETDWSEPSPAAIVPRDVYYYVNNVEPPRSSSAEATAEMEIIQWLPDVGTPVLAKIPLRPGQMIGGREDVEVVEPQVVLEEQTVIFKSNDYVVDTEPSAIDTSAGPGVGSGDLHADLNIPSSQRGQVRMMPQALVVDQSGRLKVLSPETDARERNAKTDYIKQMMDYFAYLKAPEIPEGGEGMLGFEGMGEGMEGGYGYGGAQRGSGSRSARNRLRARRGSAGGGY